MQISGLRYGWQGACQAPVGLIAAMAAVIAAQLTSGSTDPGGEGRNAGSFRARGSGGVPNNWAYTGDPYTLPGLQEARSD
jgi:hypothetical protein